MTLDPRRCRRCEGEGWLYQNTAPTMAEDKGQFRRVYCTCLEGTKLKDNS